MEILRDYKLEEKCLRDLKSLIKKNPEVQKFTGKLFDDKFLLNFVRWSKYDTKKTYSTLENYIHVRKVKFPEFFKSIRPSRVKFDTRVSYMLEQRDRQGRYVFVNDLGNWHPNKCSWDELLKERILGSEEELHLEDVDIHGIVVIYNFANFGREQINAIGVREFKKLMDIFYHSFPLKVKVVHIVNEMYLVKASAKLIQRFLPKKIRERLVFHGDDFSSLHEYISPEGLPKSLGGNLPDEDKSAAEEMNRRILQKEEFYEELAKML